MRSVEIKNIVKRFGEIIAVNNVNLVVNEGEMFGLIGPDGAGKTTLIKSLCGLERIDEGNIKVFGKDLKKHQVEIQKNIGYLSQKFSLYRDLSIDENIEFFAEIHNQTEFEERREYLLKKTRLIKFRDRLAGKLSGGMKQKLALACSLIHKPKLLILDEPTTGVDPVSRREFWSIVEELKGDGLTILLTTPYLDEAERCNNIGLMEGGRILKIDTPSNLKENFQYNVYEIVTDELNLLTKIIKENSLGSIQKFGDRINLITNKNISQKIMLSKINSIKHLSIREITPSIENIFIKLLEEKENEFN